MLEEGSTAPDFTLSGHDGKDVSISQFKGQSVILYFYPKDSTPGCTKEACSFRDDFKLYTEKNTVILGVSKDSVESHKKFIEKQNLPFILLSDPEGQVCELYGVWKEKVNFGKRYMGIERTTFHIDPEGKIKKIYKRVKVDGHSAKVLELL